MGEDLVRTLVNFPKFLAGYVVGLICATLSDLVIFTVLIAAIAIGFLFGNPVAGVAFFFAIHAFTKIIGDTIYGLAQAIYRSRQPILPSEPSSSESPQT